MNENLEAAQSYAEIMQGEVSPDERSFYAGFVTAYATLAIAETLYEERDAPDLLASITEEGWLRGEGKSYDDRG